MFSGIGGFRSGLEAAGGFECIGFCEIDKNAAKAYRAIYNTEKEAYFSDAREIDTAELGEFDLLVAGFPSDVADDKLLYRMGSMTMNGIGCEKDKQKAIAT